MTCPHPGRCAVNDCDGCCRQPPIKRVGGYLGQLRPLAKASGMPIMWRTQLPLAGLLHNVARSLQDTIAANDDKKSDFE